MKTVEIAEQHDRACHGSVDMAFEIDDLESHPMFVSTGRYPGMIHGSGLPQISIAMTGDRRV
ncbi:hypothetical protein J2T08_005625 [Neorhizobium galegae]|uniref:hypothetical protein n=1 Tax=Neorhizobium galegae TaxID=399 RepID=UPI002786A9F3|nr:hypothetical protein [Neorhizobium galegae]MDQ0137681.1 hypothetical protein [Neorhizobium galegae]